MTRPVMLTLVRGDSNVTVRHNGQSYRVCVYRTAQGWSSFVESARYLEGCTGHQTSIRAAWHAALRIVSGVQS